MVVVPDYHYRHRMATTVAKNGDETITQTPLLRFVVDLLFNDVDLLLNHVLIMP